MTNTVFMFFSGKGGVGKTTMACATAVQRAEAGLRTLIVTTDPASNLSDVFEQEIGHNVVPVQGIPSLWAMEIDPDVATDEYKEQAMEPLRELFPAEILAVMEEQFNSPCTAEIASFDRFIDFMDTTDFDVVIFDTAPTGHTMRLLELPGEWSRQIEISLQGSGQTCLGPVGTIQESKVKYDRAISIMRDLSRTTFVFVTQPEATPIAETERSAQGLDALGIRQRELIVNGIIPPDQCQSPFFRARADMQARYLQDIDHKLPWPTKRMYLLDQEIKGVTALQRVADLLYEKSASKKTAVTLTAEEPKPVDMKTGGSEQNDLPIIRSALLPSNGQPRTIFFAGKGGVGKTALSCITAVWAAHAGFKTLLLTTDPASHLGHVLEQAVTDTITPVVGAPGLWVTRIDAKHAAQEYKQRVLDGASSRCSAEMLAMLAEELDSPCTEEMAAFDKFIEYASAGGYDVVVFDTAPTGHTLRLLELPVDWSKQLEVKAFATLGENAVDAAAKERFAGVIAMMRDPYRCTFAFVTYPESTPIIEAYRAMKELETVGVNTSLVVANMVLPSDQCTNEYFRRRRAMQEHYLLDLRQRFATPVLEMPLLDQEIRGLDLLVEAGKMLLSGGSVNVK